MPTDPTSGVIEITLRVVVDDAAALIEAGQRSIARDNHPGWQAGQPSPAADDPEAIIDSPAQAMVDLLMEGFVRCFGYNGATPLVDKVPGIGDLQWEERTWTETSQTAPGGTGRAVSAPGVQLETSPASPVYLAITNTDNSGIAHVVGFASEAAYLQWEKRLRRLTGDTEEPFGFREERGLTYTILTPEQALALVPDQPGGALTIPEDAWLERGQRPDPSDPTTAHFQLSDRLWATLTINGMLFFAEAYALVQDEQQAPIQHQNAVQDDDELGLYHQATHGDGPFQAMTIRGREYVVVITPQC